MIREDIFWSHVDKNGPIALVKGVESNCWMWTGAKAKSTGDVYYGCHGSRKVHRVAYTLVNGPIPGGMTLDHLCRRPLCVNPDHLEPVTLKENILRGNSVPANNARKTHCKRGHLLEGENLEPWALANTGRECKECKRMREKGYQRHKKPSYIAYHERYVRENRDAILAKKRAQWAEKREEHSRNRREKYRIKVLAKKDAAGTNQEATDPNPQSSR